MLDSAEAHWVRIEEEGDEEGCENGRGKSPGHKSYDLNWSFLQQAAVKPMFSSHKHKP